MPDILVGVARRPRLLISDPSREVNEDGSERFANVSQCSGRPMLFVYDSGLDDCFCKFQIGSQLQSQQRLLQSSVMEQLRVPPLSTHQQ